MYRSQISLQSRLRGGEIGIRTLVTFSYSALRLFNKGDPFDVQATICFWYRRTSLPHSLQLVPSH